MKENYCSHLLIFELSFSFHFTNMMSSTQSDETQPETRSNIPKDNSTREKVLTHTVPQGLFSSYKRIANTKNSGHQKRAYQIYQAVFY